MKDPVEVILMLPGRIPAGALLRDLQEVAEKHGCVARFAFVTPERVSSTVRRRGKRTD